MFFGSLAFASLIVSRGHLTTLLSTYSSSTRRKRFVNEQLLVSDLIHIQISFSSSSSISLLDAPPVDLILRNGGSFSFIDQNGLTLLEWISSDMRNLELIEEVPKDESTYPY